MSRVRNRFAAWLRRLANRVQYGDWLSDELVETVLERLDDDIVTTPLTAASLPGHASTCLHWRSSHGTCDCEYRWTNR